MLLGLKENLQKQDEIDRKKHVKANMQESNCAEIEINAVKELMNAHSLPRGNQKTIAP